MVVNDLDRHMTFAYVMNEMAPGILGYSLLRWRRRPGRTSGKHR
jgi:hypothetical protein